VESVSLMFELSEAFNALTLRNACILFILEKFDQLSVMPWYVLDFSILNYIIFLWVWCMGNQAGYPFI